LDLYLFQLKCCGRNGPTDYLDKIFNGGLPASCCEGSCLNPSNIHGGCHDKIINVMSGNSEYAKYGGIGLIVVEVRWSSVIIFELCWLIKIYFFAARWLHLRLLFGQQCPQLQAPQWLLNNCHKTYKPINNITHTNTHTHTTHIHSH